MFEFTLKKVLKFLISRGTDSQMFGDSYSFILDSDFLFWKFFMQFELLLCFLYISVVDIHKSTLFSQDSLSSELQSSQEIQCWVEFENKHGAVPPSTHKLPGYCCLIFMKHCTGGKGGNIKKQWFCQGVALIFCQDCCLNNLLFIPLLSCYGAFKLRGRTQYYDAMNTLMIVLIQKGFY